MNSDNAKRLESFKRQLSSIEKEIENFELDPDDYTDAFDEWLDGVYEPLFNYDPSYILKQIDPTAYRCELLDYVDGLDKEDNADYQALIEQKEDLEAEIADLEEGDEDEDK